MGRTILHCDLNGFYASVECLLNPEYKDIPMAVAGNSDNRHGIVLAKNEKAKAFGIKTAETIWQAKRQCPDMIFVPPHFQEYRKYSILVNEIYRSYSDLVESFGIDESWIDVTGVMNLFGDGKKIADQLRARVKKELGLTISVGVSFNKVFAKLGSDLKKPDATSVITEENFRRIVWSLPVDAMLYVGKKTKQVLESFKIYTLGDLAKADKRLIIQQLGKVGAMLHDHANGFDDSPVLPAIEERDAKSVGNGMTFRRDLQSLDDVIIAVTYLADEVGFRMRQMGVKCNTVSAAVKDANFRNSSYQKTLASPTNLAKVLRDTVIELIKEKWSRNLSIRTLTITGMNLVDEDQVSEQLSLFDNDRIEQQTKQKKIEDAMEKIRDKYGKDAIHYSIIKQNDLGI